jgi:3-oxoacyl-[acyl-carrier protein] reductase
MDAGFDGKVVLVTGAAGGLGAEMARAFAREGARVVLHYRNSCDAAERLLDEIGTETHTAIQADLTREEEVGRLWALSEQHLGPVEVVVANAGIWVAEDVPLHEMSLRQWNETVTSDLTSVFLCMREFFRGIQRHRLVDPSAVLIGSTAAVFGEAGHADYAAAKGGLVYGLMLSLKNEITRLAPRGRVNAVCPGWTVTPMTERFMDEPATVRRALQTMPLRKVGRPEDVASAVLFLASGRLSGHVTGQMIMTCGGMEGRVLFQPDEINPEQA